MKLEEERGISSNTQHTRNKKRPRTRRLDSGILQTTPKRGGGGGGGEEDGMMWLVREVVVKVLVGELGYDIRHLVDVDELDPRFEIFVGVLPDELGVGRPAKMGRDALVALLDEDPAALHAEVGLVQPELPPGERLPVAAARLLGDVELEPGPVEADRLADRFDVGRFEG